MIDFVIIPLVIYMVDMKKIFSKNLIKLRKSINYSQAELANVLNYTDKAISKWERGESMPDIYILKKMAEFFGVTIDYLLEEHKDEELIQPMLNNEEKVKRMHKNHLLIVGVSVLGIWFVAIIVMTILNQLQIKNSWISYIAALPTSFLVAFILACVWGRKIQRFWLLSLFTWSVILLIYLCLLVNGFNIWMLFIIGVPAQTIEILSFNIHRSNKKST